MKKIFYLPIVAIVAGLLLCTACKKTYPMRYEVSGNFIYLSESYKDNISRLTINAKIMKMGGDSILITGYIPNKFCNTKDTLWVKAKVHQIAPNPNKIQTQNYIYPICKIINIKEQ